MLLVLNKQTIVSSREDGNCQSGTVAEGSGWLIAATRPLKSEEYKGNCLNKSVHEVTLDEMSRQIQEAAILDGICDI
jgi:hypothetical protein